MNSATLYNLALIADDIYRNVSAGGEGRWNRLSDTYLQDDEGFNGALYECGANLVVAYRGTTATSLEDIKADLNIMADNLPKQFKSADELFLQGQQRNTSGKEILVVGHSLGGGLSQLVAAKHNVLGVSFNGPGMTAAAQHANISINSGKVLNVVLRWDPVSSFGQLIGKKLRLPNWEITEAHYQTTVIKAIEKSKYRDQTPAAVYDALE
ncbi:DUF2974 domain-containing protein [Chloroflexi bacterium TSY]|nr:DUF2974 domain-containing protein [Chloroflexi bacterium TSY]